MEEATGAAGLGPDGAGRGGTASSAASMALACCLSESSSDPSEPVSVSVFCGSCVGAGRGGVAGSVSLLSMGVGLAMPVPRRRIGNSSSAVLVAIPVPGFRMGNSSSSVGLAMGIGPDILPRMDWWWLLGRGAWPLDLKRLTFMLARARGFGISSTGRDTNKSARRSLYFGTRKAVMSGASPDQDSPHQAGSM